MNSRIWWVLNTYIWAFCAVGWFWSGYMVRSGEALLVSLGCITLAVLCGYFAEDAL